MTRSTLKAGEMKAGDTIAQDGDLLSLLNFNTTAEGVRVGDALRDRLASAEAAAERHAAGADDATLAGEDAQAAHEAEAARLQRIVDRLGLAITRADARLAEVAAAERRSAGEAAAARAVKLADSIERKLAEYVEAARRVAELLAELDRLSAELTRERDLAISAGMTCAAQLPDEARFVPERTETREVIDRQRAAGVFDANGRPLNGKPIEWHETRRVETVIVQRRHAPPAVTAVRALLPNPDGGNILDRNPDRS